MEIKRYDTTATMSRVTEHNGILYFCGHVAAKGESMTEQAHALFARFDELFAQFGTDKDHMLMATIYMPDISLKGEFNAVWDQWITDGCAPARVCVQAGLGDTPYHMEISVIAVKKD